MREPSRTWETEPVLRLTGIRHGPVWPQLRMNLPSPVRSENNFLKIASAFKQEVSSPLLCKEMSRMELSAGGWASGLEHVHSAHHVLPADGTLAHALATLGAGDHVPALEQDAVDDGIHADPAQAVVLLVLQLQPLTI